jgi:guanyl-specific ribonuclease Sa
MMAMSPARSWFGVVFAIGMLGAWLCLINHGPTPTPMATPTPTPTSADVGVGAMPLPGLSTANAKAASVNSERGNFPPEAQATLRLIASNGPFPFQRDGVVFGNFEHRLPEQPRGYYREYTVPTPGSRNRGARRIIAGGEPPRVFYYTGDHYQSFQRIEGKP